jgi:tRNA_anti-like
MVNPAVFLRHRTVQFAIVAIVAVSGCKDPNSTSAKQGASQSGKQEATQVPVIAISAVDLCTQLRNDNVTTERKYKKQQVEVSGVVKSRVAFNFLKVPEVQLVGKDNDPEFSAVYCRFIQADVFKVLSLLPGQSVKFRGKYEGLTSATLENSTIVEAGPLPVPEYTIAELRRKLGANPQTKLDEWNDQRVVLKGTLSGVEPPKPGERNWRLTAEDLATGSEPPLKVRFEAWTHEDCPTMTDYVRGLKSGSPFRVFGMLAYSSGAFTIFGPSLMPE